MANMSRPPWPNASPVPVLSQSFHLYQGSVPEKRSHLGSIISDVNNVLIDLPKSFVPIKFASWKSFPFLFLKYVLFA
jgi:hypothetical protein